MSQANTKTKTKTNKMSKRKASTTLSEDSKAKRAKSSALTHYKKALKKYDIEFDSSYRGGALSLQNFIEGSGFANLNELKELLKSALWHQYKIKADNPLHNPPNWCFKNYPDIYKHYKKLHELKIPILTHFQQAKMNDSLYALHCHSTSSYLEFVSMSYSDALSHYHGPGNRKLEYKQECIINRFRDMINEDVKMVNKKVKILKKVRKFMRHNVDKNEIDEIKIKESVDVFKALRQCTTKDTIGEMEKKINANFHYMFKKGSRGSSLPSIYFCNELERYIECLLTTQIPQYKSKLDSLYETLVVKRDSTLGAIKDACLHMNVEFVSATNESNDSRDSYFENRMKKHLKQNVKTNDIKTFALTQFQFIENEMKKITVDDAYTEYQIRSFTSICETCEKSIKNVLVVYDDFVKYKKAVKSTLDELGMTLEQAHSVSHKFTPGLTHMEIWKQIQRMGINLFEDEKSILPTLCVCSINLLNGFDMREHKEFLFYYNFHSWYGLGFPRLDELKNTWNRFIKLRESYEKYFNHQKIKYQLDEEEDKIASQFIEFTAGRISYKYNMDACLFTSVGSEIDYFRTKVISGEHSVESVVITLRRIMQLYLQGIRSCELVKLNHQVVQLQQRLFMAKLVIYQHSTEHFSDRDVVRIRELLGPSGERVQIKKSIGRIFDKFSNYEFFRNLDYDEKLQVCVAEYAKKPNESVLLPSTARNKAVIRSICDEHLERHALENQRDKQCSVFHGNGYIIAFSNLSSVYIFKKRDNNLQLQLDSIRDILLLDNIRSSISKYKFEHKELDESILGMSSSIDINSRAYNTIFEKYHSSFLFLCNKSIAFELGYYKKFDCGGINSSKVKNILDAFSLGDGVIQAKYDSIPLTSRDLGFHGKNDQEWKDYLKELGNNESLRKLHDFMHQMTPEQRTRYDRVNEEDERGDCVICLDEMTTENSTVCCLNSHYLHTNCFKECLKKSSKCPICRQKMVKV